MWFHVLSMKALLLIVLFCLVLPCLATGIEDTRVLRVVPLRIVVVPTKEWKPLGWARPGQTFEYLGTTKSGYVILVPGTDGTKAGFVVFRDEWGHPTAESSSENVRLAEKTVKIKAPVQIQPGPMILMAGWEYPATLIGDSYLVHCRRGEFEATVKVAKTLVTLAVSHKTPKEKPIEVIEEKQPEEPVVPVAPVEELVELPDDLPAELPAGAVKSLLQDLIAGLPEEELMEEEAPGMLKHIGIGAGTAASSTHLGETGEGEASVLVDGDPKTRWSSEYSEPQEVIVRLKEVVELGKLRLHWEAASAADYVVSVSEDGKNWRKIRRIRPYLGKEFRDRVDEVDMKKASARFIKLDLLKRANPDWGFSLYEIEVQRSD